ncbi:hypothetical protein TPHA_0P00310 [Tetrapisispora phaffii CBS 4417]|uniref:Uncharacterized protein n=1 Tax=Tetrapisispora phaffii (strain ATCC 24235 / CBS 4417 / NBRC 1672 / NRRL Y-8282 / UCD 70-5) TaxID=1071381 RepID=G8C211_TETPH|nr:hypothetical protein TPHA_0P00310 [Tetrapisispora phaffii CBS 4417]CCE66189.1 hypothetical protein TPHA_0P00310 [Tetrapisispora phaffii CBS 4417]
MSDQGRKNFSEQIHEEFKPDSQKSYAEQGKEYISGTADKLQGKMTPNEDKGLAQGAHDSYQQGKSEAQAKETSHDLKQEVNDYYMTAKEKLNEAAKYVSKSMHGDEGSK